MLRYSLRKFHPLLKVNRAQFSVRASGDFEFHEFDSFTKVLLNKPKALNSLNLDMINTLR